MLEQIAKHGGFSLELTCKGDLHIDEHHTVEDCALALGQALKSGARRQARHSSLWFSAAHGRGPGAGRDRSVRAAPISCSKASSAAISVGQLPTELVPHFFRSLAETLGAAINIKVTGENTHHMIEACFKGVGPRTAPGVSHHGHRTAEHQGHAVNDRLAIIDSGGANIASLQFAIERLGVPAELTTDPRATA